MSRWIPQEYQDYVLNKIAECDEQAMVTQQPTTYYNVVRPPVWVAETTYVAGDLRHPPTPNSKIYECIIGGTTGATEPGWGTLQDGTFSDGTVTWKTHDNYALVNRAVLPADFTITDSVTPAGRKLTLSEKMGITTHTAGFVSHVALICSTDKSLRFVSIAQTTVGSNELESGRTTIFYELTLIVKDPIAP